MTPIATPLAARSRAFDCKRFKGCSRSRGHHSVTVGALPENFQSLFAQTRPSRGHACHIAARSREARSGPAATGSPAVADHDWNARASPPRRQCCRSRHRHDHAGGRAHQLDSESVKCSGSHQQTGTRSQDFALPRSRGLATLAVSALRTLGVPMSATALAGCNTQQRAVWLLGRDLPGEMSAPAMKMQ